MLAKVSKRGFLASALSLLLFVLAAALLLSLSGESAERRTRGSEDSRPFSYSQWQADGDLAEFGEFSDSQAIGSFVTRPWGEQFFGGLQSEWEQSLSSALSADHLDNLARSSLREELFFNRDAVDFSEWLSDHREKTIHQLLQRSSDYSSDFILGTGGDKTRHLSFVRNIEWDYQSSLGERNWQAGLSALGAFRETTDDAIVWQLRAYGGEESRVGSNAGFIYRRVVANDKLLGVNAFLDYEKDNQYGGFWRWSYGGEFRSDWFDAFANHYLGITDDKLQTDGTYAYTQDGVDVEAIVHSPDLRWLSGGLTYYRWKGQYGNQDDDGIRYHVGLDLSALAQGTFWGGFDIKVEYDVPETGDNNWGGRLSYSHLFGGPEPTDSVPLAFSFDPRAYFFAPVEREYGQRIRRSPLSRLISNNVTVMVVAGRGGIVGGGLASPTTLTMSEVRAVDISEAVTIFTDVASSLRVHAAAWTLSLFENSTIAFESSGSHLNIVTGTIHLQRNSAMQGGLIDSINGMGVTITLIGTDIQVGRAGATDDVEIVLREGTIAYDNESTLQATLLVYDGEAEIRDDVMTVTVGCNAPSQRSNGRANAATDCDGDIRLIDVGVGAVAVVWSQGEVVTITPVGGNVYAVSSDGVTTAWDAYPLRPILPNATVMVTGGNSEVSLLGKAINMRSGSALSFAPDTVGGTVAVVVEGQVEVDGKIIGCLGGDDTQYVDGNFEISVMCASVRILTSPVAATVLQGDTTGVIHTIEATGGDSSRYTYTLVDNPPSALAISNVNGVGVLSLTSPLLGAGTLAVMVVATDGTTSSTMAVEVVVVSSVRFNLSRVDVVVGAFSPGVFYQAQAVSGLAPYSYGLVGVNPASLTSQISVSPSGEVALLSALTEGATATIILAVTDGFNKTATLTLQVNFQEAGIYFSPSEVRQTLPAGRSSSVVFSADAVGQSGTVVKNYRLIGANPSVVLGNFSLPFGPLDNVTGNVSLQISPFSFAQSVTVWVEASLPGGSGITLATLSLILDIVETVAFLPALGRPNVLQDDTTGAIYTVTATGGNGNPYTYRLLDNPQSALVIEEINGVGVLRLTSPLSGSGTLTIGVEANDGFTASTVSVEVVVVSSVRFDPSRVEVVADAFNDGVFYRAQAVSGLAPYSYSPISASPPEVAANLGLIGSGELALLSALTEGATATIILAVTDGFNKTATLTLQVNFQEAGIYFSSSEVRQTLPAGRSSTVIFSADAVGQSGTVVKNYRLIGANPSAVSGNFSLSFGPLDNVTGNVSLQISPFSSAQSVTVLVEASLPGGSGVTLATLSLILDIVETVAFLPALGRPSVLQDDTTGAIYTVTATGGNGNPYTYRLLDNPQSALVIEEINGVGVLRLTSPLSGSGTLTIGVEANDGFTASTVSVEVVVVSSVRFDPSRVEVVADAFNDGVFYRAQAVSGLAPYSYGLVGISPSSLAPRILVSLSGDVSLLGVLTEGVTATISLVVTDGFNKTATLMLQVNFQETGIYFSPSEVRQPLPAGRSSTVVLSADAVGQSGTVVKNYRLIGANPSTVLGNFSLPFGPLDNVTGSVSLQISPFSSAQSVTVWVEASLPGGNGVTLATLSLILDIVETVAFLPALGRLTVLQDDTTGAIYTVTATGGNGNQYIYRLLDNPPSALVIEEINGVGVLRLTSPLSGSGTLTIGVEASDGFTASTVSVEVVVVSSVRFDPSRVEVVADAFSTDIFYQAQAVSGLAPYSYSLVDINIEPLALVSKFGFYSSGDILLLSALPKGVTVTIILAVTDGFNKTATLTLQVNFQEGGIYFSPSEVRQTLPAGRSSTVVLSADAVGQSGTVVKNYRLIGANPSTVLGNFSLPFGPLDNVTGNVSLQISPFSSAQSVTVLVEASLPSGNGVTLATLSLILDIVETVALLPALGRPNVLQDDTTGAIYTVTATGGNGNQYTYRLLDNPPSALVIEEINGVGVLRLTSPLSGSGTLTIGVEASDGFTASTVSVGVVVVSSVRFDSSRVEVVADALNPGVFYQAQAVSGLAPYSYSLVDANPRWLIIRIGVSSSGKVALRTALPEGIIATIALAVTDGFNKTATLTMQVNFQEAGIYFSPSEVKQTLPAGRSSTVVFLADAVGQSATVVKNYRLIDANPPTALGNFSLPFAPSDNVTGNVSLQVSPFSSAQSITVWVEASLPGGSGVTLSTLSVVIVVVEKVEFLLVLDRSTVLQDDTTGAVHTVTAVGGVTNEYVYTLVDNPPVGLTVENVNNVGVLGLTAPLSERGTLTVKVEVDDGFSTSTVAVEIVVVEGVRFNPSRIDVTANAFAVSVAVHQAQAVLGLAPYSYELVSTNPASLLSQLGVSSTDGVLSLTSPLLVSLQATVVVSSTDAFGIVANLTISVDFQRRGIFFVPSEIRRNLLSSQMGSLSFSADIYNQLPTISYQLLSVNPSVFRNSFIFQDSYSVAPEEQVTLLIHPLSSAQPITVIFEASVLDGSYVGAVTNRARLTMILDFVDDITFDSAAATLFTHASQVDLVYTLSASQGVGNYRYSVASLTSSFQTETSIGENTGEISFSAPVPGFITLIAVAEDESGGRASLTLAIEVLSAVELSDMTIDTDFLASGPVLTLAASGGAGDGYSYESVTSLEDVEVTEDGVIRFRRTLESFADSANRFTVRVRAKDRFGGFAEGRIVFVGTMPIQISPVAAVVTVLRGESVGGVLASLSVSGGFGGYRHTLMSEAAKIFRFSPLSNGRDFRLNLLVPPALGQGEILVTLRVEDDRGSTEAVIRVVVRDRLRFPSSAVVQLTIHTGETGEVYRARAIFGLPPYTYEIVETTPASAVDNVHILGGDLRVTQAFSSETQVSVVIQVTDTHPDTARLTVVLDVREGLLFSPSIIRTRTPLGQALTLSVKVEADNIAGVRMSLESANPAVAAFLLTLQSTDGTGVGNLAIPAFAQAAVVSAYIVAEITNSGDKATLEVVIEAFDAPQLSSLLSNRITVRTGAVGALNTLIVRGGGLPYEYSLIRLIPGLTILGMGETAGILYATVPVGSQGSSLESGLSVTVRVSDANNQSSSATLSFAVLSNVQLIRSVLTLDVVNGVVGVNIPVIGGDGDYRYRLIDSMAQVAIDSEGFLTLLSSLVAHQAFTVQVEISDGFGGVGGEIMTDLVIRPVPESIHFLPPPFFDALPLTISQDSFPGAFATLRVAGGYKPLYRYTLVGDFPVSVSINVINEGIILSAERALPVSRYIIALTVSASDGISSDTAMVVMLPRVRFDSNLPSVPVGATYTGVLLTAMASGGKLPISYSLLEVLPSTVDVSLSSSGVLFVQSALGGLDVVRLIIEARDGFGTVANQTIVLQVNELYFRPSRIVRLVETGRIAAISLSAVSSNSGIVEYTIRSIFPTINAIENLRLVAKAVGTELKLSVPTDGTVTVVIQASRDGMSDLLTVAIYAFPPFSDVSITIAGGQVGPLVTLPMISVEDSFESGSIFYRLASQSQSLPLTVDERGVVRSTLPFTQASTNGPLDTFFELYDADGRVIPIKVVITELFSARGGTVYLDSVINHEGVSITLSATGGHLIENCPLENCYELSMDPAGVLMDPAGVFTALSFPVIDKLNGTNLAVLPNYRFDYGVALTVSARYVDGSNITIYTDFVFHPPARQISLSVSATEVSVSEKMLAGGDNEDLRIVTLSATVGSKSLNFPTWSVTIINSNARVRPIVQGSVLILEIPQPGEATVLGASFVQPSIPAGRHEIIVEVTDPVDEIAVFRQSLTLVVLSEVSFDGVSGEALSLTVGVAQQGEISQLQAINGLPSYRYGKVSVNPPGMDGRLTILSDGSIYLLAALGRDITVSIVAKVVDGFQDSATLTIAVETTDIVYLENPQDLLLFSQLPRISVQLTTEWIAYPRAFSIAPSSGDSADYTYELLNFPQEFNRVTIFFSYYSNDSIPSVLNPIEASLSNQEGESYIIANMLEIARNTETNEPEIRVNPYLPGYTGLQSFVATVLVQDSSNLAISATLNLNIIVATPIDFIDRSEKIYHFFEGYQGALQTVQAKGGHGSYRYVQVPSTRVPRIDSGIIEVDPDTGVISAVAPLPVGNWAIRVQAIDQSGQSGLLGFELDLFVPATVRTSGITITLDYDTSGQRIRQLPEVTGGYDYSTVAYVHYYVAAYSETVTLITSQGVSVSVRAVTVTNSVVFNRPAHSYVFEDSAASPGLVSVHYDGWLRVLPRGGLGYQQLITVRVTPADCQTIPGYSSPGNCQEIFGQPVEIVITTNGPKPVFSWLNPVEPTLTLKVVAGSTDDIYTLRVQNSEGDVVFRVSSLPVLPSLTVGYQSGIVRLLDLRSPLPSGMTSYTLSVLAVDSVFDPERVGGEGEAVCEQGRCTFGGDGITETPIDEIRVVVVEVFNKVELAASMVRLVVSPQETGAIYRVQSYSDFPPTYQLVSTVPPLLQYQGVVDLSVDGGVLRLLKSFSEDPLITATAFTLIVAATDAIGSQALGTIVVESQDLSVDDFAFNPDEVGQTVTLRLGENSFNIPVQVPILFNPYRASVTYGLIQVNPSELSSRLSFYSAPSGEGGATLLINNNISSFLLPPFTEQNTLTVLIYASYSESSSGSVINGAMSTLTMIISFTEIEEVLFEPDEIRSVLATGQSADITLFVRESVLEQLTYQLVSVNPVSVADGLSVVVGTIGESGLGTLSVGPFARTQQLTAWVEVRPVGGGDGSGLATLTVVLDIVSVTIEAVDSIRVTRNGGGALYTLQTSGGSAPYRYTIEGSLTANLTVISSGEIGDGSATLYLIALLSEGIISLTLSASDGFTSATMVVELLVVDDGDSVRFVPSSLPPVWEQLLTAGDSNALRYQVQATGGIPPYRYSLVAVSPLANQGDFSLSEEGGQLFFTNNGLLPVIATVDIAVFDRSGDTAMTRIWLRQSLLPIATVTVFQEVPTAVYTLQFTGAGSGGYRYDLLANPLGALAVTAAVNDSSNGILTLVAALPALGQITVTIAVIDQANATTVSVAVVELVVISTSDFRFPSAARNIFVLGDITDRDVSSPLVQVQAMGGTPPYLYNVVGVEPLGFDNRFYTNSNSGEVFHNAFTGLSVPDIRLTIQARDDNNERATMVLGIIQSSSITISLVPNFATATVSQDTMDSEIYTFSASGSSGQYRYSLISDSLAALSLSMSAESGDGVLLLTAQLTETGTVSVVVSATDDFDSATITVGFVVISGIAVASALDFTVSVVSDNSGLTLYTIQASGGYTTSGYTYYLAGQSNHFAVRQESLFSDGVLLLTNALSGLDRTVMLTLVVDDSRRYSASVTVAVEVIQKMTFIHPATVTLERSSVEYSSVAQLVSFLRVSVTGGIGEIGPMPEVSTDLRAPNGEDTLFGFTYGINPATGGKLRYFDLDYNRRFNVLDTGLYTVSVGVTYGNHEANNNHFTLVLDIYSSLSIDSAAGVVATVRLDDTAVALYTIQTSNGDGNDIRYALVGTPNSALSLHASSGILFLVDSPSAIGTISVTLSATDASSSSTVLVDIVVEPALVFPVSDVSLASTEAFNITIYQIDNPLLISPLTLVNFVSHLGVTTILSDANPWANTYQIIAVGGVVGRDVAGQYDYSYALVGDYPAGLSVQNSGRLRIHRSFYTESQTLTVTLSVGDGSTSAQVTGSLIIVKPLKFSPLYGRIRLTASVFVSGQTITAIHSGQASGVRQLGTGSRYLAGQNQIDSGDSLVFSNMVLDVSDGLDSFDLDYVVGNTPTFSANNSYTLTTGLESSNQLAIFTLIIDVLEVPPLVSIVTPAITVVSVWQGDTTRAIYTVQADEGDGSAYRYAFIGTAPAAFSVNVSNGEVHLTTPLSGAGTTATVTLEVSDDSTSAAVTVEWIILGNVSIISATEATITVYYDSTAGVYTLQASGGYQDSYQYRFLGNSHGLFLSTVGLLSGAESLVGGEATVKATRVIIDSASSATVTVEVLGRVVKATMVVSDGASSATVTVELFVVERLILEPAVVIVKALHDPVEITNFIYTLQAKFGVPPYTYRGRFTSPYLGINNALIVDSESGGLRFSSGAVLSPSYNSVEVWANVSDSRGDRTNTENVLNIRVLPDVVHPPLTITVLQGDANGFVQVIRADENSVERRRSSELHTILITASIDGGTVSYELLAPPSSALSVNNEGVLRLSGPQQESGTIGVTLVATDANESFTLSVSQPVDVVVVGNVSITSPTDITLTLFRNNILGTVYTIQAGGGYEHRGYRYRPNYFRAAGVSVDADTGEVILIRSPSSAGLRNITLFATDDVTSATMTLNMESYVPVITPRILTLTILQSTPTSDVVPLHQIQVSGGLGPYIYVGAGAGYFPTVLFRLSLDTGELFYQTSVTVSERRLFYLAAVDSSNPAQSAQQTIILEVPAVSLPDAQVTLELNQHSSVSDTVPIYQVSAVLGFSPYVYTLASLSSYGSNIEQALRFSEDGNLFYRDSAFGTDVDITLSVRVTDDFGDTADVAINVRYSHTTLTIVSPATVTLIRSVTGGNILTLEVEGGDVSSSVIYSLRQTNDPLNILNYILAVNNDGVLSIEIPVPISGVYPAIVVASRGEGIFAMTATMTIIFQVVEAGGFRFANTINITIGYDTARSSVNPILWEAATGGVPPYSYQLDIATAYPGGEFRFSQGNDIFELFYQSRVASTVVALPVVATDANGRQATLSLFVHHYAEPLAVRSPERVTLTRSLTTGTIVTLSVSGGIVDGDLNYSLSQDYDNHLALQPLSSSREVLVVLSRLWVFSPGSYPLTISVDDGINTVNVPIILDVVEDTPFAAARRVIQTRCTQCHATSPTFVGYVSPAGDLVLEEDGQILASRARIHARAVVDQTMPPGNATGMTEEERNILGAWSGGE